MGNGCMLYEIRVGDCTGILRGREKTLAKWYIRYKNQGYATSKWFALLFGRALPAPSAPLHLFRLTYDLRLSHSSTYSVPTFLTEYRGLLSGLGERM